MASDIVVILSTFPDAQSARNATRALVEEKLVACGNLVPGVESIYAWKGEIEASAEVLVIFKTTQERVPPMMERLRALHPYEVPEILQLPVEAGWPDYLSWVRDSVVAS